MGRAVVKPTRQATRRRGRGAQSMAAVVAAAILADRRARAVPDGAGHFDAIQGGTYVQLHPESLKEAARQGLVPGAIKLSHLGGRKGSWRFSRTGLDQFIAGGGLTTDQRDRLRGAKPAGGSAAA
jgi:hypothetical protein